MADVAEHMQRILEEHRKKNPSLYYRFIDSTPDALRISTQTEGYQIVKEAGSGTVGEVRVGDLVLAGKPMDKYLEEDKARQRKTEGQLDAVRRQFDSEVHRNGAYGKYLAPLGPNEMEFRKSR